MVNKLLATVFDHIKNVGSVSNVIITSNYLSISVNDDDDDVNRIVRLGHILGLTVICSPSSVNHGLIVSFNL